jgi:hypothetical protein
MAAELVRSQRSDWTPSMPMVVDDGTALPSYRMSTSILYAMPNYTPDMRGPLQVDHHQAALIQAHLYHHNIRRAVEQANENYRGPFVDEILQLHADLTAMTTERDNLQERLTAATTAIGHWPNGDFDGDANDPQSLESKLSQCQDQYTKVVSQSSQESESG